MKFLYLFLTVITYATAVFAENKYVKKCPTQCAFMTTCVAQQNFKGKYSYKTYPPEGPVGQCFCADVQQYLTCLNCYQGREAYDFQSLSRSCQNIGVQTGAAGANTPAGTGATGTGAAGVNGAAVVNNSTNTNSAKTTNLNSKTNNTTSTETDSKESGGKGGGSKIGIIVIAVVAAVAVGGFFVYTRKQKQRPESMPFFGNSAASPNQFATLSTPKEINDISTSNLTTDYNTQFYPNVDNSNQYGGYNQNSTGGFNQGSTYNNPYEPPQQDYNNQYDPNYQNYSNQYPVGNYENEVAAASAIPSAATIVDSSAHYESRRESMMPGSQPTMTNFNGAYVCAYKYDPQLDDELQLQVNDQVQIIEEYEDGWMKAINLTTGKEGMAPRVCIREA